MEFDSVLAARKSNRAYLSKPVSRADLETIVLAGNTSAIGRADYKSLHFTVVTDKNLIAKIEVAAEIPTGKPHALYEAPAVIVISGGEPIAPGLDYANAACIVETMHLKATDLGLGSLYVFGCSRVMNADEGILKALGIPEGFRVLSSLAVGYPKDPETANAPRKPELKMGVNYVE